METLPTPEPNRHGRGVELVVALRGGPCWCEIRPGTNRRRAAQRLAGWRCNPVNHRIVYRCAGQDEPTNEPEPALCRVISLTIFRGLAHHNRGHDFDAGDTGTE